MKKKSFSVFFWIFVVLVAVLLFFVMGTTVEGFGTRCNPAGNTSFCNACPSGQTVGCNTNNDCTCNGKSMSSGSGSGSGSTSTKNKTPACSTGNYINGHCAAVA